MSRLMRNQHSAYAKTKAQISFAVTAKLISAFVFATLKVQFLFFLNPKFQASSHLQCLYSPVCVGPVQKPHYLFSHEADHMYTFFVEIAFIILDSVFVILNILAYQLCTGSFCTCIFDKKFYMFYGINFRDPREV